MEEEKGSVHVEAETGGEATTQRLPTATRRQKRRGIDSSLEPPEGAQSASTLIWAR